MSEITNDTAPWGPEDSVATPPKKRGRKKGSVKEKPVAEAPVPVTSKNTGATGPIMPKVVNVDPAGERILFENFKPTPQGQRQLPLKDEYKQSCALHFTFFRADQMQHVDGSEQALYWRPVRKDDIANPRVYGDLTFGEMFLDTEGAVEIWDDRGYYPRGPFIKSETGRECRESYLAARPAEVFEAEQKLRASLSAQSGAAKAQETSESISGIGKRDSQGQVLSAAATINPAETNPMSRAMVTSQLWSKVGKP